MKFELIRSFSQINLEISLIYRLETNFTINFQLQRRHEQMRRSLEQQVRELEEKRRAFESERQSWEQQTGHSIEELRRRSLEANSKE